MFGGENRQLATAALVLAFALLGVIAVQAIMVPQSAEAVGCKPSTPAFNASTGRCFHP